MTGPASDDPNVRWFTAEVDPGNSVNDQLAAQAVEELHQHVDSARKTLTQGARTDAMAVIAVALDEAEDIMPRVRLASLLAAALVELAELPGDQP